MKTEGRQTKNMKQVITGKKRKIILLYIILGLCTGAVVYFAAGLALDVFTRGQGQKYYSSVVSVLDPGAFSVRIRPVPAAGAEEPAFVPDEDKEEIHEPLFDFDEMRKYIPGITAWIFSEGTAINYPVVQADDNYFYLSRLPDKSSNNMGSIFLDYRNSPDFSDENILIYGHNMSSGDMFGSLNYYRDQSYYDRHPVLYIFTREADYELTPIAGYILDSAFEIPPISFRDSSDFERYISDIKSRSVFKSDEEAEFGDRLVFLCTCVARGAKNDRIIIVGRLTQM
ncbi:MAG: class B sortase [Oscillospiraceae bacterium]|nr:class B sortase [Oscillospiraceae bacterium]